MRIRARVNSTRIVLLPILAVVAVASGCVPYAGTWEDDSRNWRRAFGEDLPEGCTVLHSRYWRSPHWSYECEYFFVLRDTEQTRNLLFATDQLEKYDAGADLGIDPEGYFGDKPSWYLPRSLEHYEVWIFKEEPRQNFRLFIDEERREIFITDWQV